MAPLVGDYREVADEVATGFEGFSIVREQAEPLCALREPATMPRVLAHPRVEYPIRLRHFKIDRRMIHALLERLLKAWYPPSGRPVCAQRRNPERPCVGIWSSAWVGFFADALQQRERPRIIAVRIVGVG